jgi:hypothetical protein
VPHDTTMCLINLGVGVPLDGDTLNNGESR